MMTLWEIASFAGNGNREPLARYRNIVCGKTLSIVLH